MKNTSPLKWFASREGLYYLALALLLVVILPLALDPFRLNMVGKYLTYAFVAIGLVMCWGKAGILSLGQGVFFGLGGYCMAMFLKLEASTPEATAIQSQHPVEYANLRCVAGFFSNTSAVAQFECCCQAGLVPLEVFAEP